MLIMTREKVSYELLDYKLKLLLIKTSFFPRVQFSEKAYFMLIKHYRYSIFLGVAV